MLAFFCKTKLYKCSADRKIGQTLVNQFCELRNWPDQVRPYTRAFSVDLHTRIKNMRV